MDESGDQDYVCGETKLLRVEGRGFTLLAAMQRFRTTFCKVRQGKAI